ncbi:MAG TPA: type II secretion system F family protein [Alphaproteobacteria bacterium]|nr:type II secretion system F family protein [Alphaproteobacteria bacterium]
MIERLASLDPMILGAVLVLVLAVIVVGIGLINSLYGPRARLERRLSHVGPAAERGGKGGKAQTGMRRRDIEAKLKAAEQMKAKQRGYKLREQLIQAGLKTTPKQFFIYSGVCALLTALLTLPFGLPLFVPGLALVIGGLGIPRFILGMLVKRRIKKFTANFAEAIDLIVRGVRTGMTVAECLGIVGREMPEPIGIEFRAITEGLQMGLTLEDCMNRFTSRVPSNETRFFSIVLVTQQTTGGNLAETLAKLATILRDRKRMRDKIRALSSEAKSSAGIIGSLPFAVGAILSFIAPDYVSILFTTSAGNWCVFAGFLIMTVGVLVMRKMINFEI